MLVSIDRGQRSSSMDNLRFRSAKVKRWLCVGWGGDDQPDDVRNQYHSHLPHPGIRCRTIYLAGATRSIVCRRAAANSRFPFVSICRFGLLDCRRVLPELLATFARPAASGDLATTILGLLAIATLRGDPGIPSYGDSKFCAVWICSIHFTRATAFADHRGTRSLPTLFRRFWSPASYNTMKQFVPPQQIESEQRIAAPKAAK